MVHNVTIRVAHIKRIDRSHQVGHREEVARTVIVSRHRTARLRFAEVHIRTYAEPLLGLVFDTATAAVTAETRVGNEAVVVQIVDAGVVAHAL